MYYFAYGSNLNKTQMAKRCPKAKAIGPMTLPQARLVFRGVADVEYDESGEVHGGLWRITRECERALDRYEGVAGGLYRKEYILIEVAENGKRRERRCLVYIMNADDYAPPSYWYLGAIRLHRKALRMTITALTALVAFCDPKMTGCSKWSSSPHRANDDTSVTF